MSVLSAVRLGRATGSEDPRPRLDLIAARARRDLAAGERLLIAERRQSRRFSTSCSRHGRSRTMPQCPIISRPAPPLRRDVEAGALLTMGDVALDPSSALLRLRPEQDRVFAT